MFLKIPVYLHNLINNALGTFFISLTKNIHTYPPPWMVNGDFIGEGFSKSEALSGYKKNIDTSPVYGQWRFFWEGTHWVSKSKVLSCDKKISIPPLPHGWSMEILWGEGFFKVSWERGTRRTSPNKAFRRETKIFWNIRMLLDAVILLIIGCQTPIV